jgi:RNA polymerase sigma factor (sigma-70 family)
MTTRPATLLRQAIRSAAVQAEQSALSDRELLRRFAEGNDQSAFAALVGRYSGMVLRVCRRSLGNLQDAEDACQATFLVLARKAAGRWRHSVANWLYTTARQIAGNARLAAQRRARREGKAALPEAVEPTDPISGRELLAALEEELERLPARYRDPLVLCYLEGLTRDEAAARLGVPADTVKTQLERGRKRLGQALKARGCALGAGLLALAVTPPAGASPRLVPAILASVAGSPPAAVAALARGVAVNTLLNRSLLALAATAVVWLGVASWWARQTAAGPAARDMPAKEKRIDPKRSGADATGRILTGRVLGPDGKPVAGATLVLAGPGEKEREMIRPIARTDAAGRFRGAVPALPGRQTESRVLVARAADLAADWVELRQTTPGRPIVLRLGEATVPIRGRVLTLEGKPVPGVLVRLDHVQAPEARRGLPEMYEKWAVAPGQAANLLRKRLHYTGGAGLPEKLTTGGDGRFVLRGVGDGRVAALEVSAEAIESVTVRVAIDPGFDPKTIRFDPKKADPGMSFRRTGPPLYGPTFTHAARPCRVITGTVFDQKTKKPMANVAVSGHAARGWWEAGVYTKTDAAGRYRLVGLANVACEVGFGTAKPSAYLLLTKTVGPTLGLTPVTLDMPVVRGTVVTGRVTDGRTGKPIKGGIGYTPLLGNKHLADLPGQDIHTRGAVSHHLDGDGRFRFVAPPGLGIIVVQAASWRREEKHYPRGRIHPADRGKPYLLTRPGLGDVYITSGRIYMPLLGNHAYRVIDPPVGARELTVDVQLDPGMAVTGKVVGPDGKPLKGVTAAGLAATLETPATLTGATFTAEALLAEDARTVAAVHAGKKLGGTVVIRGSDKAPVLRLAPWGAVAGRVMGPDGKPVAGARVWLYFADRAAEILQQDLTVGTVTATDAGGRFRCDVPFAGQKFTLSFVAGGKFLTPDKRTRELTCTAGKTNDLGDITVKREE